MIKKGQDEFWTPYGLVKIGHRKALLEYEKYNRANLKMAYRLSKDHLDPDNLQKMNVLMAYEVSNHLFGKKL